RVGDEVAAAGQPAATVEADDVADHHGGSHEGPDVLQAAPVRGGAERGHLHVGLAEADLVEQHQVEPGAGRDDRVGAALRVEVGRTEQGRAEQVGDVARWQQSAEHGAFPVVGQIEAGVGERVGV